MQPDKCVICGHDCVMRSKIPRYRRYEYIFNVGYIHECCKGAYTLIWYAKKKTV